MSKIKKSIEIVTSTNKRLSSMSLDSRVEIKAILEKRYSDVRITDVCSVEDLEIMIERKPDLVFLGMKFVPDDSGADATPVWLTERLSEAGIAQTGSGKEASMLEHNKQLAKQRVAERGLSTAESLLLKRGQVYIDQDIGIEYPIFIKPVDGGGGSGINEGSLVHNFAELRSQTTWLIEQFQTDALLETYLPGREFSVGILQKESSLNYHLLPLEIVAPANNSGSRYLSSRIKQADSEETLEIMDHTLKSRISTFALSVFKALGGRDYGRIDIRLDSSDVPHFLEANLLPSLLSNYGNLPKASLMNINLSHEQLILQIASMGMSRSTEHSPAISHSLDEAVDIVLQKLFLRPVVVTEL